MQITNVQMRTLADQAEREFEERTVAFLRERHPGAIAPFTEDGLRTCVHAGLVHGRSLGFTWQSALVGFVTLLFEVGPDFDRHPAFARALAMRLPDENERIKAISANSSDEDWAAARAVSDRSAWSRLVDAAS